MSCSASSSSSLTKIPRMEIQTFADILSHLLKEETTAQNIAEIIAQMKIRSKDDQEVSDIWKELKRYMKLYVRSHLEKTQLTDLETIVIPAYALDMDFTRIVPDTDLSTIFCPSKIGMRLIDLWSIASEDVNETKAEVLSSVEEVSTNASTPIDNADAKSSDISILNTVLDNLYGLEKPIAKRSSLSQHIYHVRDNRSYLSNLQTFSGHRVIEIKVASFSDVLQQSEKTEWKAYKTKVVFVTENEQDPLGQEVMKILAAIIKRIGEHPNCHNATKKLPY